MSKSEKIIRIPPLQTRSEVQNEKWSSKREINSKKMRKNVILPEIALVVAVSLAMLFWLNWFGVTKTVGLFKMIGLLLPRVSIGIKLSQMTESSILYGFTIDKIVHTHIHTLRPIVRICSTFFCWKIVFCFVSLLVEIVWFILYFIQHALK